MRREAALMALFVGSAACGADPHQPITDACRAVSLPISAGVNAPTVTDVALEVHGYGVVVLATATDPQGSQNLLDVPQTIRLFSDSTCAATAISVQDDLAGSGLEESFGTAVTPSQNAVLYGLIAASKRWPVEVSFSDRDGNATTGRVRARVVAE